MLTKLGKYTIKSELGHGAMGVVYLAEDPRLHRPVALKTMSPSVAGVPDLLKRFYREAESAGKLQHPNIVIIYEIDEAEGIPFIAMEFLQGESLEVIIENRKELTTFVKLDLILQTCRALHYAHKHGIVHRDVKPANIMVLNDGMVKIVDFGIARIGEGSMTRAGLVLGTPMYMSPEQIYGKPVDARSDIFAVGVILYELLTYTSPFHADSVPAIIYKVLNETPPPLSTLVQNCPPALDAIVTRAMAKERGDRYQTAEDLGFDLERQADYLKRHMLEVYVNESQRFVGEGKLTFAREALQKALEIDSHHDMARSMLSQVQEQLQGRQTQEQIDQDLSRARDALESGLYDDALGLLEEVLRLEPGHAQALEDKKFALALREREQQLAKHLARAEESANAGDLAGTRAESERLLALDPEHKRALQLLDWAKNGLAEQERLAEVQQYIESARACMSGKDFAGALGLLEKALALDRLNLEIESLLRSARESLQREERKKLLNQRLGNIQEAIGAEDFDRAVELADECLQEFPNNPQAVKLRGQAARQGEVRRERRYADQQIQAATDFFQKNDFPAAITILEKALKKVPGDARLMACLKTVRDAQEAAAREELRSAAIGQAHELIRAGDFAGAIGVLQAALQRAGHSPELDEQLQFAREQQAEWRRRRDWQIRQVLARAQAYLREENFEEAIRLLEQSQEEAPATEIAEALSGAQARRREYEQRREETLQQALHFLQQGDPAKAVSLLDAAPKAYFKDAGFSRTYSQGQEALDKLNAIRQTTEQVDKNLAEEDWGEAEELLRQALGTYPDDPTLLSARRKLQQAQAAARRSRLVKQLEEAQLHFGRTQYRQVREQLSSSDWKAGEFPDLAKQAAALAEQARQREQEIEQRREETLQQALQFLEQGDPAKAISLLDAAPKAYFIDARFPQTYSQCQEALDKLNAIRQTTEQVDKYLAEENWGEAEELLRQALGTYPDDPTLLSAQRKLQQAQVAARRSRLLKQFEEAQLAFGRMQYREVKEMLSSPDWQAGEFPDLAKQGAALAEQARQKEQDVGRRSRLLKQLEEARLAFDRMQYREVGELLSSPKWQAGGFPDLAMQAAALAEKARQKEQEVERRGPLVKQLEEAQLAFGRMQYREVREMLTSPAWRAGEFPDLAKQGAALVEEARQKEQEGGRRSRLHKQLEEAQSALGRRQYHEVRELLSSPDWQAGEFPDLAQQAAALMEKVRQHEQETAQRQTIIQAEPLVPPPPSAAGEFTSLADTQKRLQEALQGSPPPREKEAPRTEAPRAAVAPQPRAPAAAGPAPPQPPPVSRAPKPVTGKPAVAVPVAPSPVARGPRVLPEPAKRTPMAMWVGIGVVVLALVGAGAWWALRGGSTGTDGYAQVIAIPWAEVASVTTKGGQVLHIKGQTPLQLKLPPGDYIIQFKNDQGSGQMEVSVKSGEVVPVIYTFAQVNVDAWVDELVSKK